MRSMSFNEVWMNWMEVCVFSSHMSILFNGSSTKEFKPPMRFIVPFLFVLAIEGLTNLVRKSVEIGDFKPFNYGDEDHVEIL